MTRMSIGEINRTAYANVARMDTYCREALGAELYDLIKLRASIVNGCGFCVDMHSTDLAAMGMPWRKIIAVSAWQHAGALFDDRERSVFALTDAVTRIGPDSVTDEIWDAVAAHFDAEAIGDLLVAISTINVWNRLAISTETVPVVDGSGDAGESGDSGGAPATPAP
ncbi:MULTISPECIES: carboxymuconolactone decarboxylase family protein [unclassified Brevibacterium]|uniref:carboxymuconolactone decarboxylase family protein n=1 Tax=unclassified Brevibacterium TaxID=2614124 RepID=UPI0010F863CD|nr:MULTISPECIES: carboxymuconolactone decarboxylase family protein [unclassified Brevibacterium]MCM1012972.1 carboxymuconolactone decarboxylase family protein [Brevibacterium sp. XM4083]